MTPPTPDADADRECVAKALYVKRPHINAASGKPLLWDDFGQLNRAQWLDLADAVLSALRARGRLVEAPPKATGPFRCGRCGSPDHGTNRCHLPMTDGTTDDGTRYQVWNSNNAEACRSDVADQLSKNTLSTSSAPAPAAAPGAMLPCPFCGGPAETEKENDEYGAVWCNGPGCMVNPEVVSEDSLDDAIAAWNTRDVTVLLRPAASPAEAGGWIACSERMPDPGKLVGVYGPWWSDWPIATYSDGKQMRGEPFWFAKSGDYGVDAVTHWRALPDPPAPAQAGEGALPRREYLEAKAAAAGELYADGKITRAECFKHEVDVAVQRDSGPIQTPPTSGTGAGEK